MSIPDDDELLKLIADILKNSDKEALTRKDVRRALEQKLGLPKKALDVRKEDLKTMINDTVQRMANEDEDDEDDDDEEDDDEEEEEEEEEKPKKRKRKKKKKGPKRAQSAYMFFGADMRPKLKETEPELEAKNVMRRIGELWRAATDDEKAPFLALAAKDKERYEEDKKNWVPEPGDEDDDEEDEVDEEEQRRKKRLKKLGPKRAQSAYMYFGADMRPKLKETEPELVAKNVMRRIGELWKAATDDEKAPFLEMAAKDKARYEEEKKTYVPSAAEIAASDAKEEKERKEQERKKRKREKAKGPPGAPKKPLTSYLLFTLEQRPKIKEASPELKAKEIMTKMGQMWREMDDGQKAPFLLKAEEEKERYEREYATYYEENKEEIDEMKF